ncbi:hypothetical protein MTQ13_01125 [Streptomyces sp. XM4011]|uniref:hypothetical protein n=1 Tax=Streptomyces sp. XM4011 TaxID=2929780 RepID=UPI001FFBFD95|nr:hypothetical protein [Streptomyces sp. XM4011]MCK1812892.1 hypothetical protein [Streptomyces sp. XM4011]
MEEETGETMAARADGADGFKGERRDVMNAIWLLPGIAAGTAVMVKVIIAADIPVVGPQPFLRTVLLAALMFFPGIVLWLISDRLIGHVDQGNISKRAYWTTMCSMSALVLVIFGISSIGDFFAVIEMWYDHEARHEQS